MDGAFEFEKDFKSAIDSGKIPGVVLMAKDAAEDKINYCWSHGLKTAKPDRKDAPDSAMTPDTPLRLASASKIVATVMALQCVERGYLGLDDDVQRFLPELAQVQVLTGFDDSQNPLLRPPKCAITLRHLLAHTSGLAYITEDEPLITKYRDLGFIPKVASLQVAHRYGFPLSDDPGSRWIYGPNLDWAGKLVERATGLDLEEYMHQNICAPLGITDMTYKLQKRPDMVARRADMSNRDANGVPENTSASYLLEDPDDCFAGMGLFATPNAFMAVLHSLLKDDGKLLSPAMVDAIFQPQLDAAREKSLNIYMDGRNHGGLLPEAGIRRNHSLGGLMIMEDCEGDVWRRKGCISWGGFPNLFWSIDREAGLCVLIAFQLIPFGDEQCVRLGRLFEKTIYKRLKESKSRH
ncbi:hypothetical protein E4U43_007597 [Claviceps pusilla]|uniref:Beta-lactamase-related domain-containing protein n=1 Tax=Claviceps pusilla TaxID=123648 RepID=A0A9P7NEN3_9HYPO|nr:hypothetical protein E4U43_007597 [Claviceps pusilla]